jgi:hypothetical protein
MRAELEQLFAGVEAESDASSKVGTPQVIRLPEREPS